jgi:hypothetical protein
MIWTEPTMPEASRIKLLFVAEETFDVLAVTLQTRLLDIFFSWKDQYVPRHSI